MRVHSLLSNYKLLAIGAGIVLAVLLGRAITVASDIEGPPPEQLIVLVLAGLVIVSAGIALRYRRALRASAEQCSRLTAARARERDRANEANLAKSRFVAKLSHEIRNPLSALVGTADLLVGTELSAEQRRYAEATHTAGLSLLQMVNGLLELASIERGKLTLQVVDCDLRETLDQLERLFAADALRKGLRLSHRVSDNVPAIVHIDTVRLGQILANLLSNAIKFSHSGGITVTCELNRSEPRTESRCSMHFAVEDEGIGISETSQKKLFAEFARVEETGMERYAGSGLGLAICRELVTLMGGEIGVESRSGRGSRFWFTVQAGTPAADTSPQAAPPNARGATVRSVSTQFPSHPASAADAGRVLLVDDDPANRLVTEQLLSQLGHEVVIARDGGEALEAYSRDTFAAILIDNQMPKLSGNEATRLIRSIEADGRRTPIISLTAAARPSDRDAALAAGADYYLGKPVDLASLDEALVHATAGSQRARGAVEKLRKRAVLNADVAADLHAVRGRRGMDLYEEIADEFRKQAPAWLADIERASFTGRKDLLRRRAHRLLGLCRLLGAERAADICTNLQHVKDTTPEDNVGRLVSRLHVELDAAQRLLEADERAS
jgi:signal transduction histidine kinase/DNA-binding NarL/FixJ family response regulator